MRKKAAGTVKVLLDAKIVDALDFTHRVVGVQGRKTLVTEPTPDGTTDWLLRDAGIPGFAVRVSSGAKTFIVQRKMGGSTSVKRTLGRWPAMTVEQARKRAPIWLGLMADGKDPLLVRQEEQKATRTRQDAAKQTMGWAFGEYMRAQEHRARPATATDQAKVVKWMESSPLWRMPLADIDSDAVDRTMTPLFERAANPARPSPGWGPKRAGLASARKIVRYLSAAYNRHVGKAGGARHSPFSFYMLDRKWDQVKPRESLLRHDTDAGAAWLRALLAKRTDPAPHYRVFVDYILCVLLWGGRRREIQVMQWDDVDFESKSLRFKAETTKSKREHALPLAPWAEEVLRERQRDNAAWRPDSPYVFPSRHHGKPVHTVKVVLDHLFELTGVRVALHDLRRTLGTDLAELNEGAIFLASIALNHAQQGATPQYIRKRVQLLRPLYEAREKKLRTAAGLLVSGEGKGAAVSTANVETLAAQLASDPTLERAFWAAYGASKSRSSDPDL